MGGGGDGEVGLAALITAIPFQVCAAPTANKRTCHVPDFHFSLSTFAKKNGMKQSRPWLMKQSRPWLVARKRRSEGATLARLRDRADGAVGLVTAIPFQVRPYPTQSDFEVVLPESVSTQIRQPIAYMS